MKSVTVTSITGKEIEIRKHGDMEDFLKLEFGHLGMPSWVVKVGYFRSMHGNAVIRLFPIGHSDMIVIANGYVFFVEVKLLFKKDEQREGQADFQKMIEKHGHTYIICTEENYKEVLSEIFRKHTGNNESYEGKAELLRRPLSSSR